MDYTACFPFSLCAVGLVNTARLESSTRLVLLTIRTDILISVRRHIKQLCTFHEDENVRARAQSSEGRSSTLALYIQI